MAMRIRKFILPMSIVLLLLLALAGTYYVRLRILEKQMAIAMEMDDGATITELSHAFPCPANARDNANNTPLHVAAALGDAELVRLLLHKGGDVNAKDGMGNTPLLAATCGAHATVDEQGEICLSYDVGGGGHRDVVEVLLAKGADVNTGNWDGSTPLHRAAMHGRKDIAELLLVKGADLNAKKKSDGWTPLIEAAFHGRRDVVELLLAKGADPNGMDNRGRAALQLAIAHMNPDVAEVLRKAGAKE
jgi:cytohesin